MVQYEYIHDGSFEFETGETMEVSELSIILLPTRTPPGMTAGKSYGYAMP